MTDAERIPDQDRRENNVPYRRNKPGATRNFLLSVLVIGGLLFLFLAGFSWGVRYQRTLSSDYKGTATHKTNEMYYQEGLSFQQDEDYAEAIISYKKVDESFNSYDKVRENLDICQSYYCVGVLNHAQDLLAEGKTEDALEVLCQSLQILGDNDDIKNAIKTIGTSKNKKKVELDLPEGKEEYSQ